MTTYVVDACVVAKWFIPEIHWESAAKLLEKAHDLFVPDLLYSELGSVLWKKVRKNEIPVVIAQEIILDLQKMPVNVIPSKPLLAAAFDIAHSLDRSVYDSIYLAAACDRAAQLVTADQKFYRVIYGSAFKDNIIWVEDLL
jgi:predicted nucleic acid-binding protein